MLIKAKQYHHENVGALKVHLSPEELVEIRKAATDADVSAAGGRYPPGMQEQLFAETPALKA
jgi:hypothetical protein